VKIREVKIHNWRSICDLTLTTEDLMIFIGQNNHGKSNIMSAMLFFFGEISIDNLDFHRNSNETFVEILFTELDETDETTFKKYITAKKTMRIRKKASREAGFSYHGYIEIPAEEWLHEESIGKYSKREDAEKLPLVNFLPESGRITKENFKQAQDQYIQEHHNNLNFTYELEPGPFLGAKNVAKAIFGDVYFVPSVKKAEDDLSTKGKSVFSALYARVLNKMSETNAQFREAKERIASLMRILNRMNEDGSENRERPIELTSFEETLQKELENWNTKIDVEITPPNIDDIFKVGATVWVDDGIRTDVSRKGQGLQRALIFALIHALAKLTRHERENTQRGNEDSEATTAARKASRSSYFFFEEPELYLHPQAQRELFESLLQLSRGDSQVLLCTHSSSFISLNHHGSICIVRKKNLEEGTSIFQCTEALFSDTASKDIFNMTYWINPDRGELFFARKVILTEGPTDKTILPLLANKLGVFRHNYTVIDCGSKNTIPSYLQLLNRFKIPYTVVYDKDHQVGKSPDAVASADIASARIEKELDSTLGNSLILENDIEEEIGIKDSSNKNKPYMALAHVQQEGFSMSESLKNKVLSIYSS